jgi:AAA ATPase domain
MIAFCSLTGRSNTFGHNGPPMTRHGKSRLKSVAASTDCTVRSAHAFRVLQGSTITRWSIENFKSFRNKTDIEFAPVTVFAGANSSGKSTIIQSILLLKQTVQYAPATRALALNGPMLKLGKFNDVKNAASDQDFIGIGWEIELAESDKLLFRTALNTGFQPSRLWGRSSVSQIMGRFSWEVPADTDIGPAGLGTSEALLQLQPKLATSYLRVSSSEEPSEKNRFIVLERRALGSEIGDDSGFGYIVPEVDSASLQEMLATKPDGEIVGAAPRHFFPGQVLIKFDGAKEKAFRVALALCSEETYRYRLPNVATVKVPYEVIKLFQQKVPKDLGEAVASSVMRIGPDDLVTVENLSDALLRAMASIESHRIRSGRPEKFNFLDIRPQVTNHLFEYFEKQDDVQRDAVEPQIPRLIYEGAEQAAAYFIAAVRYLGPLRDEPRPIYPLEALANPTEVGYKGEHTAAVLELEVVPVSETGG